MDDIAIILHYAIITITTFLSTLASGIGAGIASNKAIEAINIQPRAASEIRRTYVIGLALIETAAILALIIIVLLFKQTKVITLPMAIAECGIMAALAIPALLVGIVSASPIAQASLSIARQPFFSQRIFNLMLVTQVVIQTAIIFGFLVSFFIYFQLNSITTLTQACALCATGIALGFGSIGPTIGLGRFAGTVCNGIGKNRKVYGPLLTFVFISEAVIETPLILAFLISLIILIITPTAPDDILLIIKTLAAALCIGMSTLFPGLSSSKTACAAAEQFIQNPQQYGIISQASLFGQGIIDATAIYALLISLIILFFT